MSLISYNEEKLSRNLFHINGVVLASLFSLPYIVQNGTGYPATILLLFSPLAFLVKKELIITKQHKLLISALILWFSIIMMNLYRMNPTFDHTDFDQPMRFVLIIPVILYLLKTGFELKYVWVGSIIGGIVIGIMTIKVTYLDGSLRAEGHIHPLHWGYYSLITLIFVSIVLKQRLKSLTSNVTINNKLMNAISLLVITLSALGALTGLLLSGARGAWLAGLILIVYLISVKLVSGQIKQTMIAGSAILILCIISYTVPQTTVKDRVKRLQAEIYQLELSGDQMSSTGLRIQMWYTALFAFAENPLVGVGDEGLYQIEAMLVEEGKINSWIRDQTGQLHNDILDTAAKRGILGLIILLFLYVNMLIICKHQSNLQLRQATLLSTFSFILFGMTNSVLVGTNGTMVLVTILSMAITNKTTIQPVQLKDQYTAS